MKKYIKHPRVKRLLIGCAIMALSSCSQSYYAPSNHNVLMFEEEGDATIYGGISFEDKFVGLGFAHTDNIGFVSSFRAFNVYESYDGPNSVETFLFENEFVLFKKVERRLSPALNIGYGFGEMDRNNDDYSLRVHRFSLMPSFWYATNHFEFALSARFSGVYHDLEKRAYAGSEFEYDYSFSDVGDGVFTFVEPGVTIGFGFKQFKVRVQHLLVLDLSDFISVTDSGYINYEAASSNITLCYQFNHKK